MVPAAAKTAVAFSKKSGRPVDPRVAELAAGIDYRTARAQRQAALADGQAYEQAYRDAGRAMDLAELVYAIIADIRRRPPC